MPKALSAMEQLEAAYEDFIRLEKSRKVKKAKEDGEDDTPADPDSQRQYDTRATKERDDREEMDEQYGDHEPQDEADKEAEGKAVKREKRVYEEDDDDAEKSRRARKSRRGRDEEEDIQDKDDNKDNDEDGDDLVKCKCGAKVEKSQKFCHNCGDKLKKSKTSATKAIRDSQDSYLRDGDKDDDDIHGEADDMGEEEGKGDDETIITNMGRRTRPGVKKSLRENFYGDLIKSTGFDADFFDANPAVERMSDIVGDYLDASERRVASLTKSLNALAKSQAAILRASTSLQQQIDQINAQPADEPQAGYTAYGWNAQVDDLAKSQAAKNKNEQKSKLTKSLVREKLHKGMVNEVVESHVLSDFDNYMAKGYDPTQWVVDSLTDEQRHTLGL